MPRTRTTVTGTESGSICAIQLGCLFPQDQAGSEVCHVCQRAVHLKCFQGHHMSDAVPAKIHCGTSTLCCENVTLPYKAGPRKLTAPRPTKKADNGGRICAAGSDCDAAGWPLDNRTTCCDSLCHLVCMSRCILPACQGGGSGTAGPQGSGDDEDDGSGEESSSNSDAEEGGGERSNGEELVVDDSSSEESDDPEAARDGGTPDDYVEGQDDAVEVIEDEARAQRADVGTPQLDGPGKKRDESGGMVATRPVESGKSREGERGQPRKPGKSPGRHFVGGEPVVPRRSSTPSTGSGAPGRPAMSAKTQHLARSASTDPRGAEVGERVHRASVRGGSSSKTDGMPRTVCNPYDSAVKPLAASSQRASTRSSTHSSCPPRQTRSKDDLKLFNVLKVTTTEAIHGACQTREFADHMCGSIFKSPLLEKHLKALVQKAVVDQSDKARAGLLKGLKTDMIQVVKTTFKPVVDSLQENAKTTKKLVEGSQKIVEGTQKAADASHKSMASSTKKIADACCKLSKVKSGDAHAKAITANVVQGVGDAINKVFPAVKSGCDGIKDGLLEALLPATGGARDAPTTPSSGRARRRRSAKKGGSRTVDSDEGRSPSKERRRAYTPESTKLKRKHEDEFLALRENRSTASRSASSRAKSTQPRHDPWPVEGGGPTPNGHQRGAAHRGSSGSFSSSNPTGHPHYNHAQGAGRWDSGTAPVSGRWASGAAPASGSWNSNQNSNPAQGSGHWVPAAPAPGHYAPDSAADFGGDEASPCWSPPEDSTGNGYEYQG